MAEHNLRFDCRWTCIKSIHYDDDGSEEGEGSLEGEVEAAEEEQITVPITVCLALMVAYIWGGGLWFASSEDWSVLDASYFCFIRYVRET